MEPSALVTISSSSVSFSSRISPKILSVKSCRVIMPSVLPYSSTTTPNLFLFFLNSSKTFLAYKLSGINKGGRAIVRRLNGCSPPNIRIISFTETTPMISSLPFSTNRYLLKCSSWIIRSTSSCVSEGCNTITSRRCVIRSLARLSEKRKTSRSISVSSLSITPCSEL